MKPLLRISLLLAVCVNLFVYCALTDVKLDQRVKTEGEVNLREGPGLQYEIITKLPKDVNLILLDKKNDWNKVKIPNSGQTGWVFEGLVEHVGSQQLVIINQTYVRKGPGMGYSSFAILVKGRTFDMVAEQGNWYQVVLPDGNTGWISKSDAQKASKRNITTTQSTAVRINPDDNAKVLVNVNAGTEFIQLDKKGEWYLIRVSDGVEGWINEKAVKQVVDRNIIVPQKANIRNGPGTGYTIIETLSEKSRLTELQRKDNWVKVRTPSGNVGWVYQGVIDRAGVPDVAVAEPYMVTKLDCNIRHGYGTSFKILDRVSKGTILQKIGDKDNWYRIKYPPDARIGWIRNDLVESDKPIYFTNQECNIRQGYSTDFEIKRRVVAGTVLAKIEERDDWYRVYMPDGEIGWIRNDLVSTASDILITNQDCNVRQGPGTNWEKIDELKRDTFLQKLEKKDNWYRVKQESGKIGWIREDLLATLGDLMSPNDLVNVRSAPGTDNTKVREASDREVMYKIGSQGEWYKFLFRDGQAGWIRSDLVATVFYTGKDISGGGATKITTIDEKRVITRKKTDVYICPFSDCAVLITVESGVELFIVSRQNSFYEIRLPDGQYGFVKSADLYSNSMTPTNTKKSNPKFTSGLRTKEKANVRSGPELNFTRITTLPANTSLTKHDERGEWTFVEMSGGKKGWIYTPLLAGSRSAPAKTVDKDISLKEIFTENFTGSEIAYEAGTVKTLTEAPIYSEPNSSARTIQKVPRATRLTKIGRQNKWYEVQLENGSYGWISQELVDDISLNNIITVNNAPLRRSTDPNSQVLEMVPDGSEFSPRDMFENWVAVKTRQGNVGWLYIRDVAILKFPKVYARRNAGLRNAPDQNSSILRRLEEGEELQPISKKDDWYLVTMNDGNTGWISQSVVKKAILPQVMITRSTAAFREPTTMSQKMTDLTKGQKYKTTSIQGEWYQIRLISGDFAWVYKTNIEELFKGTLLAHAPTKMREGPGNDYSVVALVNPGDPLKCFNESGAWFLVKDQSDKFGYVNETAIRDIKFSPIIALKKTYVYPEPDQKYNVLRTLEQNVEIVPISQNDNWYEIKLSENQRGWVLKQDFVSKAKSRLVFTLDISNIRNGPGTNHGILKRVDPATDLMIVGEQGSWYNVKLTDEGLIGWIRKDLVFE